MSSPWLGFIDILRKAEDGIGCPKELRISPLLTGDASTTEGSARPISAKDLSNRKDRSAATPPSCDFQWNVHPANLESWHISKVGESSTFTPPLQIDDIGNKTFALEETFSSPVSARTKRDCLATPRKGSLPVPVSSACINGQVKTVLRKDLATTPRIHKRPIQFVAASDKTPRTADRSLMRAGIKRGAPSILSISAQVGNFANEIWPLQKNTRRSLLRNSLRREYLSPKRRDHHSIDAYT